MAPPGLSSPSPVGAFLNGAFPTDLPPSQVKVVSAYTNITFKDPMTWAVHPNDSLIFIGQRDGKIYYFHEDSTKSVKTLFSDLSSDVGVVWDGGFLGMVFHPDFGKPGTFGKNYFYTYYSTRDSAGGHEPTGFLNQPCKSGAKWNGGYITLKRYEVFDGTLTVDHAATLTMFKIRLYNSTHRGGGMVFGNDGFLYLATGDQAEHEVAQDISTNLDGGVLRIDVDMDPTKSHAPIRVMPQDSRGPDEISGVGYFIPDSNPFNDPAGGVFEEYYTLGHRNPHRMTKDKLTGTLYIGEVGAFKHEEVNIVSKGKNYGWPIWEGPSFWDKCADSLYKDMPNELPLLAFPRISSSCLIGGYVYRGSAIPSLYGQYICADYGYGSGNELFAVDISTGGFIQIGNQNSTTSFGENKEGELFVLEEGNNINLKRIEQDGGTFNAPLTLSATGAFTNLSTLTPANGIVPYELFESFWSDGAEKQRWLVIPNDGTHNTPEEQIKFSEDGEWEFPIGSVLIKHFELPIDETDPSIMKRLETRFMVIANSGQAYGLTYKWRADGSDADLLTNGLAENITIATSTGSKIQTWHYPSRSECLTCHHDVVGGTLGLRTRYLNNVHTYSSTGITANQLVTLSFLGMLDETIVDGDTNSFLTSATLDDPSASLDHRARSYLDLNCGYCHRPSTGNRAVFDGRLETSTYMANFFTDQLNEPLGIAGEMIVAPGDTAKSTLYQRLHSKDPSIMMPPLAKGIIDTAGAALISEWIQSFDASETGCQPSNIGMGKSASQSSTAPGTFGPEKALDGNTDGNSSSNSLTKTNNESQPWWEIDLGEIHAIKGVALWNRTDCCSDELSDFYVLVSEVPFASHNLSSTLSQSGVIAYFYEGEVEEETYIDIAKLGRYVRIQLAGTGVLSLAEVEVKGCAEEAQGLIANYFDNEDFTNSVFQRNDAQIAFDWGTAAPHPDMGEDDFSIRWEGEIEAPTTGDYTFYTLTNDGTRLWVGGTQLIDKWVAQAATEWSGIISLVAGTKVPIKMEFFAGSGDAMAELRWSGPGVSKELIPSQYLFPNVTIPVAFPVEYFDFGVQIAEKDAQLDWVTGSEVNNSHFEIERAKDLVIFEKVGEVKSMGNSSAPSVYQFFDPNVFDLESNRLYYRLRQVDLDGSSSLSSIVELTLDIQLIKVHPNPFSDEIYIDYIQPRGDRLKLIFLNNLGQEIWTETRKNQEGKIKINTQSWPRGIYFLSVGSEKVFKVLKR